MTTEFAGDAPQREPTGPDAERARRIAALFHEHNQSLLLFLTARLQSAQEAKEVAQEAYVRLLQLDQPAVHSFLRSSLFRIASNLAVDRLRRRSVEARAAQEGGVFGELDETRAPERIQIAREELALVVRCLEELPRETRRAFLLHRVEGRSTADIAGELGVSERMVRYHIERTLVYCQLRLSGASAAQARERMKR
ncbi:RNA polymerase sigma factor [Luteimonas aquatica]|uniref:RNA polymerase sigma factor n=1 Tax=Luteimonas aquatica TaxID=450364 RepID=UPI001F5652CB|nr:RNA polymerase sigma factor [Luteimonas aquatica]